MFELTFSFWRRLLGRPAQSMHGAAAQQTEERRVWLRFPADLETTCRPGGKNDAPRLSARVRNISLGGVNLLVGRPFEPGELLSVELPGATEHTTSAVLACVVHVTEQGEGEWAVGCTFARELDNEDLQVFGARRERHLPSDQRTWVRFPSNVRATFQLVAEAESEPEPARVLNLSASGVGLFVPRAIDNGTLLSVNLQAAEGSGARTILACVVHVTAQDDGQWALGCNFIRLLSEEDLHALQ